MCETSVVDSNTGNGKVAAQLRLKSLGDFLNVGTQGNCSIGLGLILHVVVAVNASDVPKRSLCLHSNVAIIIIHIKESLCGITDTPNNYLSNLDWIAHTIIDLEDIAIQRASTSRNDGGVHVYARSVSNCDKSGKVTCGQSFSVIRICPAKTLVLNGSDVLTKQHANPCLTRLKTKQAT